MATGARARPPGEIRLTYSLTQTGQEFANGLEDRGFILAHVTEEDAERLNRWETSGSSAAEEWEAAFAGGSVLSQKEKKKPDADQKPPQPTRADTWMAQSGGIAALTPELRDQALANYERWGGNKGKYDFANYVDFVQKREAERQQAPGGPEPEQQLYDRYKAGDLAVVTQYAQVHPLTRGNTGEGNKDRTEHLKDIDRDRAPERSPMPKMSCGAFGVQRSDEKELERTPGKQEEILRAAAEKALADPSRRSRIGNRRACSRRPQIRQAATLALRT